MKVDRSNPRHWIALLLFGIHALVAWLLRPVLRRSSTPLVVLYGHKLSGNLLALLRQAQVEGGWRMVFLTMDSGYARELELDGIPTCVATRPQCIGLLARAHAVVSDHGLHSMQWMPGRSSLKFFDVWHGIPFKGFDADDFRIQHRYDEIWVASPLLRSMYIERFGFKPERVHVTGYARTDRLVRNDESRASLLEQIPVQIPENHRIVLFAPTWKQDAQQRSLWPFGLSEAAFLAQFAALATAHDATVIVRTHLNSGDRALAPREGLVYLPFAQYPDTELLLLLADVLVCDWSSIAFDYLLLDRPAVFLDVEPPFAKGFALGPEHRYGAVVDGMDRLLGALAVALSAPAAYWGACATRHQQVRHAVYGGLDDGRASERCLKRLRAAITR